MIKRKAISDGMKWRALKRLDARAASLDGARTPCVWVECAACYAATRLFAIEFDHEQALVDDGAHDDENIRPVCGICHRKKSAREHKNNSKAKRLAKGRALTQAVLDGTHKRPPGKIKSRGFQKGHRPFRRAL